MSTNPPSPPPPGEWPPPGGSPPPGVPPSGGWQAPPGGWQPTDQPPGYGPQGFGTPGYGGPYGSGQIEHPQGTTILVLGILSLVVCGLLGPVAWSMGNTALKEIDANPGAYSNRGSVSAGRICGMITSAVLVLVIVGLVILVFGSMLATSS